MHGRVRQTRDATVSSASRIASIGPGMRKQLATLLLLSVTLVACATQPRVTGDVLFQFANWQRSPVPVSLFVPDSATRDSPIVIVMHGASRDLPRYYGDWRSEAVKHGFIVAVPYFSRENFAGSVRYNLGHVFDADTGEMRDRADWTFAAIEPIFDQIVATTGSRQLGYVLFGHSAGSQFVHRFLYYVPEARVTRAIAANAGWYTMPDYDVGWPYGLGGSGVPADVLRGYLARDVVVLLGDADTDRGDDNLRKTPEADRQGPHRFARGHAFFREAQDRAGALAVEFGWRLQEVPGAGHSNAAMTPAAALLVD